MVKRALAALAAAAALLLLVSAIVWYHAWQHWLSHGTGSYDTPGVAHHYNFFSGSGSDISELSLAAAVVAGFATTYRKHNCHVHGCWRIGRHPVEGTTYTVCRKHHPDPPLSAEHVAQRHRIAQAWAHRRHGDG